MSTGRQLGNPAVVGAGGFFTPAGCHASLDHGPCLLTALNDTEAVAVQPGLKIRCRLVDKVSHSAVPPTTITIAAGPPARLLPNRHPAVRLAVRVLGRTSCASQFPAGLATGPWTVWC